MNMEDILNSGANVTLTIKSTDLKEFAEHLVKKTKFPGAASDQREAYPCLP